LLNIGKNKPRHKIKKNGLSNKHYCQTCLSYNCNPLYSEDTIAVRKRLTRRKLNLCEASGNNDSYYYCLECGLEKKRF
jgi:hypothetical protein